MALAGTPLHLGRPRADDGVAVWGHSPYAARGEAVAARYGAAVLRVEDAFLRSVLPARAPRERGVDPGPMGLLIDRRGVHFDSRQPSDLEHLLASDPLDDAALLNRARAAMDWMRMSHLSKYNAYSLEKPLPNAPYVLVIDQTRGDASIKYGGANDEMFAEMLVFAQEENPGAKIIIKSHPETSAGARSGHFGPQHLRPNVEILTDPVSPWALMEGAIAVYTVSSQMGFEAILAGHRPRVFGQPWYSGWGLTQDENPVARRERRLTRAQLFAGGMMLYPHWYDPYRDRLCEIEDVLAALEAQTRAWREDRHGYVASGMRLWKRRSLSRFYGGNIVFTNRPKRIAKLKADGRRAMIWAAKGNADLRVEDGFLRSKGLGADLVPPASLVADDCGIYYDPQSPSRLERMIADNTDLPLHKSNRAEAVLTRITRASLTKYNIGGDAPALPEGQRILVVGQVEDDASIRTGAQEVRTNAALLQAARAARPDAILIYKPHPDVEKGLRAGAVDSAATLADVVVPKADPVALIAAVDEVWTITSLLGFEALLRDRKVVTLGAPFYAGYGLTEDRGSVPARRGGRAGLLALIHAAYIDYPRYYDAKTGLPCPVEVIIDRLESGTVPRSGLALRLLAKAQGAAASYAHLWR
nr:capsular polysaccharide biosynthesis protein [Aquimixticola soesokkakensis]